MSDKVSAVSRRDGASGRPRTHLPPSKKKGNTLDPPLLPLCQIVRLCVIFRPRASLYGQFCVCRHPEEDGGHSCAHALGTAAPPSHAGFTRTPDKTFFQAQGVGALHLYRCSYALV